MANIKLTKPLKVLIVDDSRAIQAIVKRAVNQCGYEPVEIALASDGEQAIEIVSGNTPDLIITDWHMPKVSGMEMLQTLRTNGHKDVKVGFVTTERTASMLAQAKESGAAFILHKPFSDAELVSTIKSAVENLVSVDEHQNYGEVAKEGNKEIPTPAPKLAQKVDTRNDPVTYMDIQVQLTTKLGNIPFRIIAGEKINPDRMTKNNFLALYQAKSVKGVYAIGVMDANALCIIGGGFARKSPIEVRSAMTNGAPDREMMIKAHEFMSSISIAIGKSSGMDVSMAKASIVQNTFEKLLEVIQQTGNRSDYRVSIPGYGDGRVAFFVLAS